MTHVYVVLRTYVGQHGNDYGIQYYLDSSAIENVYTNLDEAARFIGLPDSSLLVVATMDSLGEGLFEFEKAWAHPNNGTPINGSGKHYYIVEKILVEKILVEKILVEQILVDVNV